MDWLTPFIVMTGLGLVAGYSLLGATWLLVALRLWHALGKGSEATPFLYTIALFGLFYGGLLFSKWPYVVPPNYTF